MSPVFVESDQNNSCSGSTSDDISLHSTSETALESHRSYTSYKYHERREAIMPAGPSVINQVSPAAAPNNAKLNSSSISHHSSLSQNNTLRAARQDLRRLHRISWRQDTTFGDCAAQQQRDVPASSGVVLQDQLLHSRWNHQGHLEESIPQSYCQHQKSVYRVSLPSFHNIGYMLIVLVTEMTL